MNSFVWGYARAVTVFCVVMVSLLQNASASIVFPVSGTSAAGNPVSFSATLAISGSTLTVQLDNTSPVNSTDATDVLTSFYFDILSGTNRPTLNYTSASGSLFLVRSGTTDLPYSYTPQTFTQVSGSLSDIRAVNNGDNSWQFRTMNASVAPQLGFGIGTVGNNTFSPNGFTTQIVGQGNTMINFAIYRGGDINPNGVLNNKYLVKNTATFTFTGLTGYTEANIVDKVVFGLGTTPDSTLTVSLPEPGALALAAVGTVLLAAGRTLRRARPSGCAAHVLPAEAG
ncbi:MAG: XDD4 family exosortase-dependent surface protein [Pirellulales bacterium]